jgi:hypothetical protein
MLLQKSFLARNGGVLGVLSQAVRPRTPDFPDSGFTSRSETFPSRYHKGRRFAVAPTLVPPPRPLTQTALAATSRQTGQLHYAKPPSTIGLDSFSRVLLTEDVDQSAQFISRPIGPRTGVRPPTLASTISKHSGCT